MQWLIIIAGIIAGLSENDVIFTNRTGLPIARIEIGSRVLQGDTGTVNAKILVAVTPTRHHLRVVFRGGADVNWPHFNFKDVHEITFQREQNRIEARVQ